MINGNVKLMKCSRSLQKFQEHSGVEIYTEHNSSKVSAAFSYFLVGSDFCSVCRVDKSLRVFGFQGSLNFKDCRLFSRNPWKSLL